MKTDKLLKFIAPLQVEKGIGDDDDLTITGYASTDDKDRQNDVILASAWKGGVKDYKNNPIILAFHDHTQPIGKASEIGIDEKGLKITAKISKAAGNVVDLIKDGILSTFSVGFRIRDGGATYDKETGIFVIKKADLYEVSVVSIPANAKASFSVMKSFDTEEESLEFKNTFCDGEYQIIEETLMKKDKDGNPIVEGQDDTRIDLKAMKDQIKAELEAEARAKEAAEAAEKAENDRIEALATTAAERLLEDVKAKFDEENSDTAELLKELRDELNTKKEELDEIREHKSKMTYSDKRTGTAEISREEKANAVLLAKIKGTKVDSTDFFADLREKSGMEHWESTADAEWEEEYTTQVRNEMEPQLVVEPLFTTFPMNTKIVHFPINPAAGTAEWIPDSAFRSTDNSSTGTAEEHQLTQQSIEAYKIAAKEYVGYEETEDTLVNILPIIRASIARRMANSTDTAILRGTGILSTPYDPLLGLDGRGQTALTITNGSNGWDGELTENTFADLRRDLGIYGLDSSTLVLLVSHKLYYTMMKFDNFKTVDVAGINRATLLTGEVGSLFGLRVVVSQSFDNTNVDADTVGTTIATLVRPSNFIVGNLRGLMTETDTNIEDQRRIIVSSRRLGFQEIIANEAVISLEIAS